MNVVIQAQKEGEGALIDERFGRCGCFSVYDTETKKFFCFENEFKSGGGGVGVRAGQFVAEKGDALIGINLGPNAFDTLNAAGVKVYSGIAGKSVKENVDAYLKGELEEITSNNVNSHDGMG